MSAVVCGKRSSSIFVDELIPSSSSSPPSPPHHPSKRSRCSPARAFDDAARRREALLHHLLAIFPHMDPQLLERALEASGDDLDSAIKCLNELRLESESAEAILSATVCESENGLSTALKLSAEGVVGNGHLGVVTENPPATDNCQTGHHSSEWVELFVREMMSSGLLINLRASSLSCWTP